MGWHLTSIASCGDFFSIKFDRTLKLQNLYDNNYLENVWWWVGVIILGMGVGGK